jgi:RNA polymerase sigma-70 factor, ECF subfamily
MSCKKHRCEPFRYFRTFTGGNGRAWFLRIVRNTCTGWRVQRLHLPTDTFDEARHGGAQPAADPETLLIRNHAAAALDHALGLLPDRVRELLILRELNGLSYREIADVMGIPMGTVMSGLSRARQALRGVLNEQLKQPGTPKRTHPRNPKPTQYSCEPRMEYTTSPGSNGGWDCDSRSAAVKALFKSSEEFI